MPTPISHKYHDDIEENGFVVIRNLLSPEEIEKYLEASEKLVEYARAGHWSAVRTTDKQFPPWPKNFSPNIWGISGLLHPDLGELSTPFHDFYGNEKLLAIVCDILQVDKSQLSMELLNMLINPLTDFELDWHRDTIKPEATPEEEANDLLKFPYAGAQFNLALTEDSCLIAIPGSHNRLRTQEEREKTVDATKRKEYITGQTVVDLHPGDIVFYNNNILHRAKYSCKQKRLTLHGSYGNAEQGKSRAKGILQHGVAEWLPRLDTEGNENLTMMKEKLSSLVKEFEGVELGYALDG